MELAWQLSLEEVLKQVLVNNIVLEDLLDTKGIVNTEIKSVDCGPNKTTGIGTRTWCEVSWEYKGLPGSSLSLLPNGYGNQKTKMTSESEVVIK